MTGPRPVAVLADMHAAYGLCPLTQHQIDILQRLADGETPTEITTFMGVGQSSISNALSNARRATDALTTLNLLAMCIRRCWID